MKTSAVIRIVVWTLVALMLTGLLLAGVGGYSFFNRYLSSHDMAYSDGDIKLGGGNVNASNINRIEVEWVAGEVNISPTDGSEITFEESSRHEIRASDRMYYDVSDGRLTIRFRRRKDDWHIFGINRSLDKKLTVKLPRELFNRLDTLDVMSVSALVNVDGVKAEEIVIDSVSGGIKLAGITCDELEVSTVSGAVTGDRITARKVDSEAVSGRRSLSGSMEEINIDGISGGTDIVSAICPSRVNVDTVSGSVTLTIPENDGFTAKYDKVSGSVNTEFEATHSKNTITYKNGGARFDFTSISGSVDILKG